MILCIVNVTLSLLTIFMGNWFCWNADYNDFLSSLSIYSFDRGGIKLFVKSLSLSKDINFFLTNFFVKTLLKQMIY